MTDAPDWTSGTRPMLGEPGSRQNYFQWTEILSIPANTVNSATIYTVPAGRKLILSGFTISSNVSFVNLFKLLRMGTTAVTTWYSIRAHDAPGPAGALEFAAGQTIGRLIYNYDEAAAHNFALTLYGVEIDA